MKNDSNFDIMILLAYGFIENEHSVWIRVQCRTLFLHAPSALYNHFFCLISIFLYAFKTINNANASHFTIDDSFYIIVA